MHLLLVLAFSWQQPSEAAEPREAETLARGALLAAIGEAARGAPLERIDAVDWPSPALGCPEEDTVYAQRVVTGFRVLFAYDGAVYRVHVGEGRAVVCGAPISSIAGVPAGETVTQEPEPAIPEPTEAGLAEVVATARDDLTERLSVEPDDIELLEVESVVWPDRSLGCPRPGMVYPQVPVDGVRIRFRVVKKQYHYHGGAGREPFLCETPAEWKRSL
jgi:hypothetical protein